MLLTICVALVCARQLPQFGHLPGSTASASPLSPHLTGCSPNPPQLSVPMYVDVSVNGHTLPFLVDTGSGATIMARRLWQTVAPTAKLQPATPLLGVTATRLDVAGVSNLPLCVGGKSMVHSVYVAATLHPPCIPGRDFLTHHNCVLHLPSRTLSLYGSTVPLSDQFVCGVSASSSAPLRVAALHTTVLQPYQEVVVPCSIPLHESVLGVVECSERFTNRTTLHAARVLATVKNGVVPVRLANFGPSPVTVYASTTVGSFSICELSDVHECLPQSVHSDTGDLSASLSPDDQDYDTMFQLSFNSSLSDDQRKAVCQLLSKHHSVFALDPSGFGRTDVIQHAIPTGSARSIRQSHRRVSPHLADTVRQELHRMVSADVIRPSASAWASPVVLVKKKDGGVRFCIDYRKVNAVTVKDAFPIPRIDDTLDRLVGAEYFSALDLMRGYWQVEVEEQDRNKTAFTTPFGLYEFNVVPFGLCNAPATFQRLMQMVLAGLQWDICLAYLDDIIIFSSTFRQHLDRLDQVLQRLANAGLTLKPSKCHLLRKSVNYLGHVISSTGIAIDPAKIDTVSSWPVPTCATDVSSFLGLASNYRRFVPNFSSISAPLYQLTEKGRKFHWSIACQTAFEQLKAQLVTAPVLAYPDFSRPLILFWIRMLQIVD